MKVVINKCFGGFGVSEEGARHMAAAGCADAIKEVADYEATLAAFAHYKATGEALPGRYEGETRFFDISIKYGEKPKFHGHFSDLPRDDKTLIAAVEALGTKANGDYAKLAIVEIPNGTDYEISEYDGQERVAEKHRTWG